MATSRRHSVRPVLVEIKPDNNSTKPLPPNFAPSSPNAKKVSFAPSSDKISRPLTSTEAWSLYHFENHARQCPHCYNPLDAYRRGDRLCEAGHWLAEDVACHVYHKEGEIYSIRKDDAKLVRVEIPHGYDQLRSLLKGMDRSLRSHRTVPILSYDRSYPVSARKSETAGEPVIVEPATSARRSRHKSVRYSTVALDDNNNNNNNNNNNTEDLSIKILPSKERRGTLYEKDMQRKEKNYRVEVREPSERKERRPRDDDGAAAARRKSAVYYYD